MVMLIAVHKKNEDRNWIKEQGEILNCVSPF